MTVRLKKMKYDFSLIGDHQRLVPVATQYGRNGCKYSSKPIDAIFIPFRNNTKYVTSILNELKWYDGQIYLMPSNYNINFDEDVFHSKNTKILDVTSSEFYHFFNGLLTSNNKHSTIVNIMWDLPLKRNYALWFSRKNQLEKILLVDDDIRGLESSLLQQVSVYLDKYTIVGCFVEDFPDTSAIGHMQMLKGENIKCFLSGSFLFMKPSLINGFFPFIYNEDWLFMLNHIIDGQTYSMGSIKQMPYDPFIEPKTVIFQEFGEVVAEGLYALLHSNILSYRLNNNIWSEIIHKRNQELMTLKNCLLERTHQELINHALETIQQISASDCVAFIKYWEQDIITWNNFLKETV